MEKSKCIVCDEDMDIELSGLWLPLSAYGIHPYCEGEYNQNPKKYVDKINRMKYNK